MCKENMKTVPEAVKPAAEDSVVQHEDAALKTAFLYFSEELLPYFGITKKAVGIAATELVKLDVQKLHEDFNFIMEDGSWIHFEFQSRNKGRKDLKRFRMYEATASYQHNAAITTYVLFSGNITRPMTEYTEGINTFCIKPITMKSHSADRLIAKLQKSQENAEKLKKEDLVLLTLCLLMDGEMPLKDRVRAAFRITQEAGDDYEEMDRIEAVLYVMAWISCRSGTARSPRASAKKPAAPGVTLAASFACISSARLRWSSTQRLSRRGMSLNPWWKTRRTSSKSLICRTA